MILEITREGVTIPREWFGDVEAVELTREGIRLVILPLATAPEPAEWIDVFDPVHGLGADPVDLGIVDGSVR